MSKRRRVSRLPSPSAAQTPLPLRHRHRHRRAMNLVELRMEKSSFLENAVDAVSGLFPSGLLSRAYLDFYSTRLVLEVADRNGDGYDGHPYDGDAYAVLQLNSGAFKHYAFDREKFSFDPEKFSVDLELTALAKVFSFANDNDVITMRYKIGDMLYFRTSLGSPGSLVRRSFHLYTDLATDERALFPKPSESEYQAIVRMPSAQFMRFCNKLNTGDRKNVVTISVDKDNVRFFTDKSSAIVSLHTQNGDKPNEATCIVMTEKISLAFDLSYLKNFSKASILSDKVTIKLSSDKHALFEYEIPNTGNFRCHLMPSDKMQNC